MTAIDLTDDERDYLQRRIDWRIADTLRSIKHTKLYSPKGPEKRRHLADCETELAILRGLQDKVGQPQEVSL